jgi:hypothetical protein
MSSWRSESEAVTPFDVVLDQLIERGGAEVEPSRRRATLAYDWSSLAAPAAPAADVTANRLYIDTDWSDAAEAAAIARARTVEETVALELQLSDNLEPAEMERRRRLFAYRNHPDRFGPSQQAVALQRMTIANVLVDRALKLARSRTR